LFTNYILSWRLFFDDPIDVSEILKSVAVLFGHIIVFYGLTAYIFKRKDILT
jgi:ABC-2 type transport system permease protein